MIPSAPKLDRTRGTVGATVEVDVERGAGGNGFVNREAAAGGVAGQVIHVRAGLLEPEVLQPDIIPSKGLHQPRARGPVPAGRGAGARALPQRARGEQAVGIRGTQPVLVHAGRVRGPIRACARGLLDGEGEPVGKARHLLHLHRAPVEAEFQRARRRRGRGEVEEPLARSGDVAARDTGPGVVHIQLEPGQAVAGRGRRARGVANLCALAVGARGAAG